MSCLVLVGGGRYPVQLVEVPWWKELPVVGGRWKVSRAISQGALENIFEWQFAIRGPRDSEFEGGIYHGRIQLPAEYPFKPPSFMLLTPNGRFETQTKICLSISNHHPEHWQPSWSVRTALVALIAFMPTNPNGALGSLEYTKEERRVLAIKSRDVAPKYGTPERQKLIDEIHEYMLSKAPPVPQATPSPAPEEQNSNREDEAQAQASPEKPTDEAAEETHPNPSVADTTTEERRELALDAADPVPAPVQAPIEPPALRRNEHWIMRTPQQTIPRQADDRLFTWAAVVLTIAILALLLKKFMKANGHGAVFMDES
ncbi:Ubiquitin-conjugating enzyme E2 J1 [Capsicum annuum]|uniref:Ubiquitin-conjugating enzyme E2 J1 n=1 Tax=Capsicum annuum TaxID=4072 RepID=A0A2G2YB25_CAPAN|nr:Ubiquitin-conjugating enzyme E2 J1 [Capsicum annuum]